MRLLLLLLRSWSVVLTLQVVISIFTTVSLVVRKVLVKVLALLSPRRHLVVRGELRNLAIELETEFRRKLKVVKLIV